MYTGLQKIKGKQLQGFKLLHKNFDCASRPDVDEILIQAYYHHFSSFLCIFNALEIADHQKKNEMQVLDVDGGGAYWESLGSNAKLIRPWKKWSIYENQSWNYFPILTAFKSSLQR